MKDYKLTFLTLLMSTIILFSLSGCSIGSLSNGNLGNTSQSDVISNGQYNGGSIDKLPNYEITFVYNNGKSNSKVFVQEGKTISTPNDPEKENYIFNGWYLDKYFFNKYDFSKAVTKNLTLYAKYTLDAVTLTNKISTSSIKGVVKIENKSYNSFLGIETSSATSQGSGFCFHIQDNNYYILTNCHVAKKNTSYDKQKITIEDYQGKTYTGYLYKNPNKSVQAIAAAYDLACLYFKATSTNVQKLPILTTNPSKDDDVISVGTPKGQSNSITYGKIIDYQTITITNTSTSLSNVQFDVIHHNAYSDSGSSGGPLLNSDLKVIGVHYAGSKTTSDEYAIPAEKVYEFLKKYVYN